MTAARRRILFVTVLLIVWLLPGVAAARSVGFASMELVDTGKMSLPPEKQRYWQRKLEDLTRVLFDIKYSSFTLVASELNLSNLKPRTLEIYVPGDTTGRKLRPHPSNREAIHEFHERFEAEGESYLKSASQANQAQVIIFDELEPWVEDFIRGKQEKLEIRIRTYYADSDAMGFTFLDLDNDVLGNFAELKRLVHKQIIAAMEEMMQNQSGFAATDQNNVAPSASAGAATNW